MTLRLGIDGEALKLPLSGVGKYVFHLCSELEYLLVDAEFFAYARVGREELALPSQRWTLRREAVPALRWLPSFAWLKSRGAVLCAEDGLDVFWAGRSLHPRLGAGVRTVCTVHDLNHRVAPDTMQLSTRWSHWLWFDRDVSLADCVVANSFGTRARLARALGVAAHGVVRPGLGEVFARRGPLAAAELELLARLGVRPPYLLAVATLEPRKNVALLLRAFLGLRRAGELLGFQLVVAGAKGWQDRGLAAELEAAGSEGVKLLGYVAEHDLPLLYRAAEVLVCPSSYEGFGMTVLEARACGTRLVISDVPELREAGGPYAVAVETNLPALCAGIRSALAAPRPLEPGLAERHSWRDAARSLVPLLVQPGTNLRELEQAGERAREAANGGAPEIVIGIASADRREQLGLTLVQLARQLRLPERIVICPAAAEDFDASAARGLGCPVEVVQAPRGLCAQRNAILRACRGADVVIFLDDDFYPAADYVQRVAELFLAHPEIVAATHHPALDGATGPGVSHEQALAALAALECSPRDPRGTRPIGGAYGCNMALRLEAVFQNSLWFDENLPLYGWLEDLDFSHRLARHGRVVECAALRGVHLGTKRGRSTGIRLGYSQISNPVYLLRKGSLRPAEALKQMFRNVAKNSLRAWHPEPWVDRAGRLKGNAIALADLVTGQLHPLRALDALGATPRRGLRSRWSWRPRAGTQRRRPAP